jgi:hypothetical protein
MLIIKMSSTASLSWSVRKNRYFMGKDNQMASA